MKKGFLVYLFPLAFFLVAACSRPLKKLPSPPFSTVCNPVNLSYRFQPEFIAGKVNGKVPSYREGADPTVVLFRGTYYAFVSHSGGYYYSDDMMSWHLIVPNEVFPLNDYAPGAVVVGDNIYLTASSVGKIVKTSDPKSGQWEVANPDFPFRYGDPAFFLDDDGRLYYYAGCSDVTPIYGCELDPLTFNPVGEPVVLVSENRKQRGWEEPSDYNTPVENAPWIEGAWMNKYDGKYYLQYASPGTQFKSYNDAVLVSDNPLGPFVVAAHNPFSYKPEGFVNGAGHSSTFTDVYGNHWHIATNSISVRHMFERRLSLFPLFFDADGEMLVSAGFGDYPIIVPSKYVSSPDELFPGWMLLSYGKETEASSSLPGMEIGNINDEDIRTWWSAATGQSGEWFKIDLGEMADIYAVQTNFADVNAGLYGRSDSIYYQYIVDASPDGRNWEAVLNRLSNTVDAPHDYYQLKHPVKARYLRVTNRYTPSGNFSVSDFRVFGKSAKAAPAAVASFVVERDADRRTVHLKWSPVADATGYNIRYGVSEGKLYQNYMVYNCNELSIHSLDAEQSYIFTIDAFNEGGITRGDVYVSEN